MSQSEGTKTALTSTEAKTQKLIELLGASEKLEAGLTSVGRTAVQTLGAITRSLETADQKQSALESASDQAGVKAVKLESLASALAAQVEQTQALINGLDSSTEDAHTCKSAIDNAVIAASKAIAHAKTLNAHALSAPNAHAIDVVSSQGELAISPLTDEEAITLLRAQGIGVTDEGFLSNESIQAATGWGRPKAVKLKDVGYELGILGRKQHGKGWVYFYLKAENTETPEIPCSLEVSSIPENPENPINSSVIVGNFNRKHS
jgi:hypothetical protein